MLASYLLYKWLKPNKSGGTSDESAAGYNVSNLSFDKFTYTAFADQIEAAIWGTSGIASWWEDDQQIGDILKQMNTLDDVRALIAAYGVRTVGTILEDGGNLVESIASYLDEDIKDQVNNNYLSKGINFQWL